MTNEQFIESILQEGHRAKSKVLAAFPGLSVNQLNWKPSANDWSIAQCLDHLIISDGTYFSQLQAIGAKQHAMGLWEKYSPLSGFFGRTLKNQLQEQVKRKMTAPKVFSPQFSDQPSGIVNDYLKNLDAFLNHISNCRHADLDKTIITSPVSGFITYNLVDSFTFLLQHEHRHINQALRVKDNAGFPKHSGVSQGVIL